MAQRAGQTPTNDVYSRLRQYLTVFDENKNVLRLGKKNFSLINRIKTLSYVPWKIEMKYQYRPDNISNLYYGTPYLYWVIMGVNDLTHFQDFEISTTIKIPNRDELMIVLI